MVKFSKQFQGQLVPEWKEAFLDYCQLKKDLKKLQYYHHLQECNNNQKNSITSTIFSALTLCAPDLQLINNKESHKPIQVHRDHGDLYETQVLEQFTDSDAATEFFTSLDFQLNKVNQFFRTKEDEFLERGNLLKEQLEILIGFKTKPSANFLSCVDVEKLGRDAVGEAGIKSSKKCGYRIKLRSAEKIIRGAFIELYKGLGYLKTYRNLNMLAFVKILKKFDKVTKKEVLPIYLRVVESSYFNISDKALKLADEVEETFVKNFGEDDKKKAMKYLKPTLIKESHTLTFFIGLFTGCFVASTVGYIVLAHITGTYGTKPDVVYMETVFPLLSMFSLFFLHIFLYGCNIAMWRKTRINYSFIFELSPTKELKHNDLFFICTVSMASVMGVLFLHLSLVAKGFSYSQVQPILGLLVLAFVLVLVCPFNIIYKSCRYRFLSVIKNIVFAPLYKVAMLDFFMADQLCSQVKLTTDLLFTSLECLFRFVTYSNQVPMLRELEFLACYYITGSYRSQDYQHCSSTTYYRDLAYTISFLPYYWRAMQCARRWFDEGQKSHLINLGKYVSAMFAAGARVAYEREKGTGWLCAVVVMSSVATLYQLYWDLVKDWGLLEFRSKNPWLRDELMLKQKFIYFFSMGLNIVLRIAWLQTVLHYNFKNVDYRVTMLFLAALEVVRRGQWNFYRLENEHLNNADKFRAVKTVPLPFRVDEQH